MKNLLAIPCLMFLLAACGGTSTVEEIPGEEESLATVQSELDDPPPPENTIECGLVCPAGYAPTVYGCYGSSGCGPCPSTGDKYTTVNGTGCTLIKVDKGYAACGLGDYMSAGHYISGYVISRYCDAVTSSNGGTKPNKTGYPALPGDDYTFTACGMGCPAGYSVLSYRTDSGCDPSGATPTQKNSTSCRRIVDPTWDQQICGIVGCPSGFTFGGYLHTSACRQPGDSTTGDNTTICNGI
ncbi:hypothetical protein [Archangium sp. Cb G35]|uniref:hypothetical protein n=1 Tax=Archangium sp. Cb G35 TaxID=1920190 RepID=UPI000AF78459|nr:hypothetical protein [Archangium sp. Cb G35]